MVDVRKLQAAVSVLGQDSWHTCLSVTATHPLSSNPPPLAPLRLLLSNFELSEASN